MHWHPLPLSPERVEETIALVQSIFPDELKEDIRLAIASSQDATLGQVRTAKWNCPWNCYWIVLNERSQVIGVTGLYELSEDQAEADWIGWFGVTPSSRGQGLGAALLQFTIDQANQRSKKYLRLYTSTYPNEARANVLYEKNGFAVTRTETIPGSSERIIYRQKELSKR